MVTNAGAGGGRGEVSWKAVESGCRHAVGLRIPPREPGGKPTWSRQRTFRGAKGKCRRQAEAYRAELEAGLSRDPLAKTVGRLARVLQDERVALGAVKDRANQRDECATRYIELAFGDVGPVELTPDRITERYVRLMREHGLSASEAIKVNKKLSSVLERQRARGLIASNPAKKATLPHHDPVERQALSTEQFDTLVCQHPRPPDTLGMGRNTLGMGRNTREGTTVATLRSDRVAAWQRLEPSIVSAPFSLLYFSLQEEGARGR